MVRGDCYPLPWLGTAAEDLGRDRDEDDEVPSPTKHSAPRTRAPYGHWSFPLMLQSVPDNVT